MGDMDNDGPGTEKIIIYMYGVQELHHCFEGFEHIFDSLTISLHMPIPNPEKVINGLHPCIDFEAIQI